MLFSFFANVKIASNNVSTHSSNSFSVSLPSSIDFKSSLAEPSPGAGISKLDPAATPAVWSFDAPQSVITIPSNPHSSLKISCNKCLFSFAYTSFT